MSIALDKKTGSTITASLCWLALLGTALFFQSENSLGNAFPLPILLTNGLLLNGFIASVYYTATKSITPDDIDFSTLLWRIVITALACTFGAGVINVALLIMGEPQEKWFYLLQTAFFHIEFALLIILLAFVFIAWKRMILFDKTAYAQYGWKGFETVLALTMIGHFFRIALFGAPFNFSVGLLGVWALLLCINARWVPELTFEQKLLGVIQLLLLLVCLAFFFVSINAYFSKETLQIDGLYRSVFTTVLFGFIVAYGFFGLLFLLFNLPTSKIVERKFHEISIFQKLSDSIVEEKSEEGVYNALLESAFSSANADAGWLMTKDRRVFLRKNITEEKVRKVNFYLKKSGYEGHTTKRVNPSALFKSSSEHEFNSYMAMPLGGANGEHKGDLVLLKKRSHAFDRPIESNVKTYVSQAEVAVQNFRLLHQVMESERVKSEMDIAQKVQKSLLPQRLIQEEGFSVTAISEAASEVGGDYYDVFRFPAGGYAVIVADVAGKGISAAFNMAQMKGIFQTLVREKASPSEFMQKANAALTGCLEKSVFITASIYFIDPEKNTVTFSRAGHCPALFVQRQKKEVGFLKSKGLGLGILRNDQYQNFSEEHQFEYQQGDWLVLYTDGIVEARNVDTKEEYGYERLKTFFRQMLSTKEKPSAVSRALIKEVMAFSNEKTIDDDFTLLILSF